MVVSRLGNSSPVTVPDRSPIPELCACFYTNRASFLWVCVSKTALLLGVYVWALMLGTHTSGTLIRFASLEEYDLEPHESCPACTYISHQVSTTRFVCFRLYEMLLCETNRFYSLPQGFGNLESSQKGGGQSFRSGGVTTTPPPPPLTSQATPPPPPPPTATSLHPLLPPPSPPPPPTTTTTTPPPSKHMSVNLPREGFLKGVTRARIVIGAKRIKSRRCIQFSNYGAATWICCDFGSFMSYFGV